MNPEQWLSLKWNGGSTMSDRWLNQSKIIQIVTLIGKIPRNRPVSCKINYIFTLGFFMFCKYKIY